MSFGEMKAWVSAVEGYSLCKCSKSTRREVPAAPSHSARSYKSSRSRHIMNLLSACRLSAHPERVCKTSESRTTGLNSVLNTANAFFCWPVSSNSRYFCCVIRNLIWLATVVTSIALSMPEAVLDEEWSRTPRTPKSENASDHRPPRTADSRSVACRVANWYPDSASSTSADWLGSAPAE
jgi:hypothetical protein